MLNSRFKIGEEVLVYLGAFGKNTAQPVTERATVTGAEFYSVARDIIKHVDTQEELEGLVKENIFDGLRYEVRRPEVVVSYFYAHDIGKIQI